MEAILTELQGKKVDINCGSNVMYRGEIVSVEGGILKLKNEDDRDIFIAIDKVAAVTECSDLSSRPGFIV